VNENAPEDHRGSLGGLFQVAAAAGIFLGSVVGYGVLGSLRDSDVAGFCHAYQRPDIEEMAFILMAPGVMFGVGLMVLVLMWLPESAVWLKARGPPDFPGSPCSLADTLDPECEAMRLLTAPDSPPSNDLLAPGWAGLLQVPQALLCGFGMAVAFMLTGINAVMSYAPEFMALVGVRHKMFGACLLMFWNLLATLAALLLVDRVGRRTLLLPALGAMALAVLLLHPLKALMPPELVGPMSFVLLLVFIGGFELGPGTLFWVVCSEVLPARSAALGFSLINAAQCAFSLATTFLFPYLDARLGTKVFYVFGVPAVLVFLHLLVCLPETRCRPKDALTRDMLAGPRTAFLSPAPFWRPLFLPTNRKLCPLNFLWIDFSSYSYCSFVPHDLSDSARVRPTPGRTLPTTAS